MSIPQSILHALHAHQNTAPVSCDVLSREVRAYVSQVKAAHTADPFVDAKLAAQIAEVLLELLTDPPPHHVAWVRAGARYFLSEEDVEADFQSLTGFDDDALAVAHVAEQCGRSDLAASLLEVVG